MDRACNTECSALGASVKLDKVLSAQNLKLLRVRKASTHRVTLPASPQVRILEKRKLCDTKSNALLISGQQRFTDLPLFTLLEINYRVIRHPAQMIQLAAVIYLFINLHMIEVKLIG